MAAPATGSEIEVVQQVIEAVLRLYDLPDDVVAVLKDASDRLQEKTIEHWPV